MNDTAKQFALEEKEEPLLLEQIKYLNDEFISIEKAFLNVISIPVGIYAVIIYYALNTTNKTASNMLFLILPFLFLLSLFNIIKYTTKALGIDAYIRHMEQQINNMHGKRLFLWQTHLVHANYYSVVGSVFQIPVFLALAVFMSYKFIEAFSVLKPAHGFLCWTLLFLLLSEACLVLIALNHCRMQYGEVLRMCNELVSKQNNEQRGGASEAKKENEPTAAAVGTSTGGKKR